MDKILLFAGTTEGRNLAEFLEKNQIPTEVCVATQYGETLLEEGKYLHVHAGFSFSGQRLWHAGAGRKCGRIRSRGAAG